MYYFHVKHDKRLDVVKKFGGKFHFVYSMEKMSIHQPVQWGKTVSINIGGDKSVDESLRNSVQMKI